MKTIDDELLKIIVCPLCKGDLEYDAKNQELICYQSNLAYKIKDGIPIMLAGEARIIGLTQILPFAAKFIDI